jgi:superoxide dismutase
MSILESEYIEPTRPYSQHELSDMRTSLYRQLRLGKEKAFHRKCNHFYFVKENGRKEKEIKENSNNIGNCSVCWKIMNTPTEIRHKAYDLTKAYTSEFGSDPEFLTYSLYDIENIFYRWLYLD